MDGFEINFSSIKATGYTNKTSNVQKTDKLAQVFSPKVADNSEFYPGLNFSPEARMAAEMEKSPFMQGLNELFGI